MARVICERDDSKIFNVTLIVKRMVTRKQTRQLEKYFMQAADAYSSGYSTFNAPSMMKFGVSGGIALATWTTIYMVNKSNRDAEDATEDDPLKTLAIAGTAAFFAAFFSVLVFDTVRRQKTFANFTGTTMFMQYAMFFSVPLALLSTILKVAAPLDLKQSVLAGTIVAVAVVVVAKKFYFVLKQNDLEKQVFTQIANVLDACQSPGKAGCSHKHAGYVDAFANMVKPYIDQINYVLPDPLDAVEVARDIASRLRV
jgi:ABC-type Fe3+ transport system permease subunit